MITERQRLERRKGIGSSDAAKILGLSPYGGPWDVWAEKVGLVQDRPAHSEMSVRMRIGELMEPVACELLEEAIGERVVRTTGTFVRGHLRANIDAMVGKSARGQPIVECKNTGYTEDWGDPDLGIDAVPKQHVVQTMVHLICAESDVAHIPVVTASWGQDFLHYRFSRIKDVCDELEDTLNRWFDRHVVGGVEPDKSDRPPMFDTLDRVTRSAHSVTTIESSLIAEYVAANDACKSADERKDLVRRRIAACLGNAEIGESQSGKVTYYAPSSERFNAARFKAEMPDVYARFVEPVVGARVLRVYPKKVGAK